MSSSPGPRSLPASGSGHEQPSFGGISAVTLATAGMAQAVDFYARLGLPLRYGGPDASFTSFLVGGSYLNLVFAGPRSWSWWGRTIIYVRDVDALYQRALDSGLRPDTSPRDAPWGERFFHITDPDGHELSFAWPLEG